MARSTRKTSTEEPGAKRLQRWRLIAVNLGIFVLLVGTAELIAWTQVRNKQYAMFDSATMRLDDRPFVRPDDELGFSLVPGFDNGLIHVNSQGFRGPEFPADFKQRRKILAIGESTTFGWGAGETETYPYVLQQYLDERTDSVAVINAGVPSYTSLQSQMYLGQLLERIHPQIVIINLMWNDLLLSSAKNWFPEMLINRRISGWRMALSKHSSLYRALVLRANDEGKNVDVFNEKALAYFAANLEEMVEMCQARGVRVALMYPPFQPGLWQVQASGINGPQFTRAFMIELWRRYRSTIDEVATRHHMPVIDHRLSGSTHAYVAWFEDPAHPKPIGNRMMAEDVGDYLVRTDMLTR